MIFKTPPSFFQMLPSEHLNILMSKNTLTTLLSHFVSNYSPTNSMTLKSYFEGFFKILN